MNSQTEFANNFYSKIFLVTEYLFPLSFLKNITAKMKNRSNELNSILTVADKNKE